MLLNNILLQLNNNLVIKSPVFRAVQVNAEVNPQNTYLYTFDYTGEFTRFGYGIDTTSFPFNGGVHHSDDNLYLFPYPAFASTLSGTDIRMSEIMTELWASFATSGRPTVNSLNFDWEPFSSRNLYQEILKECN